MKLNNRAGEPDGRNAHAPRGVSEMTDSCMCAARALAHPTRNRGFKGFFRESVKFRGESGSGGVCACACARACAMPAVLPRPFRPNAVRRCHEAPQLRFCCCKLSAGVETLFLCVREQDQLASTSLPTVALQLLYLKVSIPRGRIGRHNAAEPQFYRVGPSDAKLHAVERWTSGPHPTRARQQPSLETRGH